MTCYTRTCMYPTSIYHPKHCTISIHTASVSDFKNLNWCSEINSGLVQSEPICSTLYWEWLSSLFRCLSTWNSVNGTNIVWHWSAKPLAQQRMWLYDTSHASCNLGMCQEPGSASLPCILQLLFAAEPGLRRLDTLLCHTTVDTFGSFISHLVSEPHWHQFVGGHSPLHPAFRGAAAPHFLRQCTHTQVSCFNHRVVTLVTDKLERQWLWRYALPFRTYCIRQPKTTIYTGWQPSEHLWRSYYKCTSKLQ